MDLASIIGLMFGLGAIIGGQAFEGGHIGSLIQPSAAIIVFGGTFGAMLVSHTPGDLKKGLGMIKMAFLLYKVDLETIIQQMVELANIARREGVIALERKLDGIEDPFLKKAINHMINGLEPAAIREMLETEIEIGEENELQAAEIFMTAGGYAPTLGIIGAVMGLIQVMQNLSDLGKIGEGIAVAFVATIYGLFAANIILLPLKAKIARKIKQRGISKKMMVVGVLAIQSGMNAKLVEDRLRVFLDDGGK